MARILVINGSYRNGGITDQAIESMVGALKPAGAEVETVLLRNFPIEFCLNCRMCSQQPGDSPAQCVHRDGMQELIGMIERADGYILASPTNFGAVTALFKRFMERLAVYAYWPWEMNAPKFRNAKAPRKKAVIVSSCAAPAILGRLVFGTPKQLKTTAQTIGAETVGTLFTGMIAKSNPPKLPAAVQAKASSLACKLI
jgi:multimeric flavodoxin WrbA